MTDLQRRFQVIFIIGIVDYGRDLHTHTHKKGTRS